MPAPEPVRVDVCIVGGGLVGASLALALAELPLTVAVVEAHPPGSDAQPSFDARALALANGSRRILDGLGVWAAVAAQATAIRRIHVSERGRFGQVRLDAAEQGLDALGHVLESRILGDVLWRRLGTLARTRLLAPARVVDTQTADGGVRLTLAAGEPLNARLVVAADGASSLVRSRAGVGARQREYGQTAIVTTVLTEHAHEQVAYERFTPQGPLALLPSSEGRSAVVLTLAPDAAAAALALGDEDFLALLAARFGRRLGRFQRVGTRHAFPLALTASEALTAPRTVFIGNAAQGLHPIAGQGFNVGLRDVATLAEVLADSLRATPSADPGGPALLERYARWRAPDRRALITLTDGLVRLFGSELAPLRLGRGLGLALFDLLPPAKAALARLSLGFADELPRLARGLPLVPPPQP
jgi:2-octaprenyl-6-methoxyphenol hydroxylase